MGVWIQDDGTEVLTDPKTGDLIEPDDKKALRDFAEGVLVKHEQGHTVEELATWLVIDIPLVRVAIAIGRRNRKMGLR
ncbi:hypothetical protein AB0383_19725 [Amycolatopsis sp. NPDC051373]|uniref:hypothetical protein n=1 Tax=Amycolatopsis sp. NPDC051373 TaxID=3155801 RepID=UPI00344D6342